eukprot:5398037-Prymnesium_polylepis.2
MPTCAALHAVVWASGALLPTLPSGAVCVRERLVDGLSDIFGREAVLRWVLLGQLAEGLEVDAVSVEFAHGRRDLVLEEKRAAGLQRLVELVLAHDAITIGVEAVEDPFERRMPLGRLGHHYKTARGKRPTPYLADAKPALGVACAQPKWRASWTAQLPPFRAPPMFVDETRCSVTGLRAPD